MFCFIIYNLNYFDFFLFPLHFPLVNDNHSTITSINLLFKKINFFDSLQDNNKEKKAIMAGNMVTFFYPLCSPLIMINIVSIQVFHIACTESK
jgi:hypothetical protein